MERCIPAATLSPYHFFSQGMAPDGSDKRVCRKRGKGLYLLLI